MKEETKICKSTKTRSGCYTKKPITEFGIASTNKNTGAVYRKSICRKCECSTKIIRPPSSSETVLFNQINVAWV